ncbi:IclR family transcriptional regulator [Caulobacter rhizosphaerae]|uniref:IclR family transcriptional regulator n=1 Tax=Caulobacter rhizosphaerae TaxID=2010972 RepID=UPI0013D56E55|nr:IclR family transcriptional regulator [Caulobacter rhizosphaerae]GGL35007.1 IclR family transcriptional regulator [Caulobacter rhizosphaerae]
MEISNAPDPTADEVETKAASRTLVRGLEVLNAVSRGHVELGDLAATLGLTRTTTYRLATTLVEHRYLSFTPRVGYALGPKLLELGFIASRQTNLAKSAREHLEVLSSRSADTVHLGVLDQDKVLYLDKIAGSRRVDISSRIGERQPLRSTGLGKALLLDASQDRLVEVYQTEQAEGRDYPIGLAEWLGRMAAYRATGVAFDLEENPDHVRCVAAPVRDVEGKIVAAISLTSARQYMDDARMNGLSSDVLETAWAISRDLGWRAPDRSTVLPSPQKSRPAAAPER